MRLYSVEKPTAEENTERLRRLNDDVDIERPVSGPSDEYVKKPYSDLFFFRFGYFNYIKLNTDSMVHKFDRDAWYTFNLIFNFDKQFVSIYVQGSEDEKPVPTANQTFYTERKETLWDANALSIYNLTPGSACLFRNFKVCESEVCEGTEIEGVTFEDVMGAASLLQWVNSASYTTLAVLTAMMLAA